MFFIYCKSFSEMISNDKPIIMNIDDRVYYPYIIDYAETDFGGELETTLTIKDILSLISFENENNWLFSY